MKHYLAIRIKDGIHIMNDQDELGGLIDMDVKHEVLGEVCDDEEFSDNCKRDCQHFCNGTCKATPMRDVFGDLWHVLASKETMNQ